MLDINHIRALPQTNQVTIPPEYLDEMGHLNVAWYIYMFDRAAWGAFKLFGVDLHQIDTSKTGVFALEQHIRYLAEVRLGETINIHTRFIGRSRKALHFLHVMVNDSTNTIASTFEGLGVNMDMQTRRSALWSPDWLPPLDAIIAEHNALEWEAPLCGVIAAR